MNLFVYRVQALGVCYMVPTHSAIVFLGGEGLDYKTSNTASHNFVRFIWFEMRGIQRYVRRGGVILIPSYSIICVLPSVFVSLPACLPSSVIAMCLTFYGACLRCPVNADV